MILLTKQLWTVTDKPFIEDNSGLSNTKILVTKSGLSVTEKLLLMKGKWLSSIEILLLVTEIWLLVTKS